MSQTDGSYCTVVLQAIMQHFPLVPHFPNFMVIRWNFKVKHNHPNERCLAELKGSAVYYAVQISVNYELRKKGSEKKTLSIFFFKEPLCS